MILLVIWEIWKHRNRNVFDDDNPNVQLLMRAINEEAELWMLAGAVKLRQLRHATA